jgi:hypothetical protein
MDLVDEQHVARFEVGEDRCEIAGLGENRPGGGAEVHSQFAGDDFARSLISESASEQRAIPEPEKQLADVILRLRNAAHDATMASLSSTLADASLPDQERLAALSEQNRLRSEKRKPLHPLGDA